MADITIESVCAFQNKIGIRVIICIQINIAHFFEVHTNIC
ncbi:unnamed protein product, partial [marine sediment metagenome]